ncbi:DUF1501 domain-containing protein [Tautonia plasticadhaerens]|uniref:Sulfatase n=1 Tax=Tautonia plasticadhaerens TaxID=2527974 RepID=A0A518H763_9BACT|nr:DUF1501 domain-containing protein [Tautonia plasticadhaerens]QDV36690.1 hypothetical protein ElP_46190 [Tautonia plasticadhaerens]
MDPILERINTVTRRHFFGRNALGLGTAALASMLPDRRAMALGGGADENRPAPSGGLPGLPHFAPKAKRAIYLFMSGAPSQLDMFDYKPAMDDLFDTDLPESIRKGQRLTTMTSGQDRFPIAPSKYKFERHGGSGAWVSELLPHTAKMVDDLAIVRSMHTEAINHDPAITYICTGHQLPGRASLGAWLSYGLGTMNANLPDFVVMTPTWSGRKDAQALYNRLWGSGYLPSKHQGVRLRTDGDPVLFLSDPPGVSQANRRRMLDTLGALNQKNYDEFADPETQARIAQYEMAFRMQTSVPELMDLTDEPKNVLDMYGPDVTKPGTFAYCALMARRLAERDVRFVQLFHRGWDQHGNIAGDLPNQCRDIDQPSWALVQDLKQRGLLDDTLVVWGGEFGRTIYCQGALTRDNYGRDHHPRCFTVWMAGGGIKPGIVHGETDEFSYNVTKDPVHIHELNATILQCLGIDHRRLTYKFQGLDQRLTGVEDPHPVDALLA